MVNALEIAKDLRKHLGNKVSLEGNLVKAYIVPHVPATLCRVGENRLGDMTVYFNKNFLEKREGEELSRKIRNFCEENNYLSIKEENNQRIPVHLRFFIY